MIKSILKGLLNTGQYYSARRKITTNGHKLKIDFSGIRRTLCIQMNAIGDSIMTYPALSAISQSPPDVTLDLICRPHIAPLYRHDKIINNIFSFEPQVIRSWTFKKSDSLKQLLSEKRYDLIVDFSALPLTAAFCATQSISQTIGFSRKMFLSKGGIDLGDAYDWSVPYSESAHLRDLMLKLVHPLAATDHERSFPKLTISPKARLKADNILNLNQLKKKGYIVIHPGAKWLPKRWPIGHCRELIKLVTDQLGVPIVLLGGPDDGQFISCILDDLNYENVHQIIGADLTVSSAIIKNSLLCVNNDSAAMHIAAAVGTSSISIFGPVSPDRSSPSVEEGCHVFYDASFCSPCSLYYRKSRCRRGINFCMHNILPSDVFQKIKYLLP